jgi:uncharacterized protein (TIGR02421 family)
VDAELARYAQADAELVGLVKDIKILSTLSWPKRVQDEYLSGWREGNPKPPVIEYPKRDYRERREALTRIAASCDPQHPVGSYLQRTAHSWQIAMLMLEHVGETKMAEYCGHLYGRPGDRISGSSVNNLEAAQHFIQMADEFVEAGALPETEYCLSAHTLKREMEMRLGEVFTQHNVRVEVDPDLISKAAAGPTRIRLRAGTCFSEYDLSQLLEHEAFVHSLTALNGRSQRHLGSLGLNSPRITATQEGLAVFAELVTGSIDIQRMKRISLRILAVDMALNGADFIDVFKFFLEHGQSENDSFFSAMRVYRGVPTTGGAAFTKDTVYLHGLLSVHTFFRWALRSHHLGIAKHLFAGKMTLKDVIELEPFFESGYLDAPLYLPPWLLRANGLAGYLSFSLFANRIRLEGVERDDVVSGFS